MNMPRAFSCSECGQHYQVVGAWGEHRGPQAFCSDSCLELHLARCGGSKPLKKLQTGPYDGRHQAGEGFVQRAASHSEAEFCIFLLIIRGIASSEFVKRLISINNIKEKVEALSGAENGNMLDNFLLATDICRMATRNEITTQSKPQIIQKVLGVCELLKKAAGISKGDSSSDSQIYSLIARNTIDTLIELHLKPLPCKDTSSRKEAAPPTHLLFVDFEQHAFHESHLVVKESPLLEYEVRLLSYRADFKDISINEIINSLNNGCISSPNFILVEKTKHFSDTGEAIISLRILQEFEPAGSVLQSEVFLSRMVKKNQFCSKQSVITLHIHFSNTAFGQEMDFCFQIVDQSDLFEVEELVSVQLRKLFAPYSAEERRLLYFKFTNSLFCSSISSRMWLEGRNDRFQVIQYNASPSDLEFDHESEDLLYTRDEIEFMRRHKSELLSQTIVKEAAHLADASISQVIKQFQMLVCSVFEPRDRIGLTAEEKTALRCLRLLKVLKLRNVYLDDLHPISFVFPPMDPHQSELRQFRYLPSEGEMAQRPTLLREPSSSSYFLLRVEDQVAGSE